MTNLNKVYTRLLSDIYFKGIETSPRGLKCKELLAHKIILEDPHDNVITLPGFETNLDYAKEELGWYLSGSNRVDYSPLIEKVWKKYSDNGVTVNSAYGYYIFTQKQWQWCLSKLAEDRDSRQAVININQPYHKFSATKDFPCTVCFQLLIRYNKLHWITFIRSNDVYFGFRNDVYCFTELQKIAAAELGVEVGTYTHFAGSIHLYEKHFSKVKELFKYDQEKTNSNL